jgi:hypothetical protein
MGEGRRLEIGQNPAKIAAKLQIIVQYQVDGGQLHPFQAPPDPA